MKLFKNIFKVKIVFIFCLGFISQIFTMEIADQLGSQLISLIDTSNPSIDSVKTLIEGGANLNFKDSSGYTALMLAAISNKPEMLKMLIDARANLDLRKYTEYGESTGPTALMEVVHYKIRDIKILKMLIDAGANLDLRDNHGNTALILAIIGGINQMQDKLEIVKILINARANLDVQNEDGETGLMFAVTLGYTDLVEILLASKANPRLRDKKNKSASDWAKESDDIRIKNLFALRSGNISLHSKKTESESSNQDSGSPCPM